MSIPYILSPTGNLLFAVHRSLQLLHNIDVVYVARMYFEKIVIHQWKLTKQSNRDAVIGQTAPSQTIQSNRTPRSPSAQSIRTSPNEMMASSRLSPSQIPQSNRIPRTPPNEKSTRTAPSQLPQSKPTAPNLTAQTNDEIDTEEELERLQHNHRVYLVLQFLR